MYLGGPRTWRPLLESGLKSVWAIGSELDMQCYLCGKQIGVLRSILDQQYCTTAHRREARLASAQVLREEDDEQELWSVTKKGNKKDIPRVGAPSGQTPAVAILALAALVVAMILLPGGKSSAGGNVAAVTASPTRQVGLFARTSDTIGSFVRERAPVTLHHDFQTGMSDWVSVALNNATKVDDPHDWKTPSAPSLVLPGTLRLWAKSTSLRNYQMDFAGQIERKSLSWAFRASNPANYYGSKIEITKPGPQPNADLIHFVMLDGREHDRVQLPLPLTLEKGSEYRVRVSVQDDRFVTFLNGQVISSWSDKRLTHGGVGFFSDVDDEQQVSWVSLSERDSVLGRMLAHFGFYLLPTNIEP